MKSTFRKGGKEMKKSGKMPVKLKKSEDDGISSFLDEKN